MSLRFPAALTAAVLATAVAACDVEQTREGELPEVQVDPGRLPEYDVDAPDLDIVKDTKVVVVPKLRVDTSRRDTTPR